MKRLYQPNLTCSFDICMTDDNNLWTLVMKNHDDAGITDDQFVQTLWQFANTYTARLIEEKSFDLKEDTKLPEVSALVTHDKRFKTWNIIINTIDIPLNQTSFILNVAELAKQLADRGNIDLSGVEKNPKGAPNANA